MTGGVDLSGLYNDTYLPLLPCTAISIVGSRSVNYTNSNTTAEMLDLMNTGNDFSWVLTSAIIIFTMQTGFGVLESGCVSPKNEINIMVKNVLDVSFGGVVYWAVGFGISYGTDIGSNAFAGYGCFFVDAYGPNASEILSIFLFQLSFSTTATTIVSGAMAERTKLHSYLVFSALNTIVFSVSAHWIWSDQGFLFRMGAVDVAGCGPVHVVGGASGMVATLMLKPRKGAFDNHINGDKPPNPAPMKSILGLFMLWWGWIRFTSGSVFLVSTAGQWESAMRAAVNTIVASMGGGIGSIILSVYKHVRHGSCKYDVSMIINGTLGSLVSITAFCTLSRPYEAFVIGMIGSVLANLFDMLLWRLKIDDPVSVIPVHGVCGTWGLLAVGLFLDEHHSPQPGSGGLLKHGDFWSLGVQTASVVVITAYACTSSFILLKSIDLTLGLRWTEEQEDIGADIWEHGMDYYRKSAKGVPFPKVMSTLDPSFVRSFDKQETPVDLVPEMESELEFGQSVVDVFKTLAESCAGNGLQLVITKSAVDVISLEIRMTDYSSLNYNRYDGETVQAR